MGGIIKKFKANMEKILVPFALVTDTPTNPHRVPLALTAPEGLALVCSASNPSEADLIRQILEDAGFHVEYVPSMSTGIFGTTGSPHVYVHAGEEESAREFLRQLEEEQSQDNQ